MKYTDFDAVSRAMETLRKIKDFEQMWDKTPEGGVTLTPPNGSSFHTFTTHGITQDTHQGSDALNALVGRMNTGNHAIRSGIRNGLKEMKKELCTFLHDHGVDTTELQKELKL